MDNFDQSESSILSSVFDGIPMRTEQGKECINVQRTHAQQSTKSIVMKTGFREPDEIRVRFKTRPLGIQIKPLNLHGFGAKITKVTNDSVTRQGGAEQMVISGLNNKDLLGCTFDQIMAIVLSANLPFTLRLMLKSCYTRPLRRRKRKRSASLPRLPPGLGLGPKRSIDSPRTATLQSQPSVSPSLRCVDCAEPPSMTPSSQLMLASFSRDNMPLSTVLSSSSDEDDDETAPLTMPPLSLVDEKRVDESSDEDAGDDDDVMAFVNWNSIRLGASVIKHGWGLDPENSDEDETTFDMAYDQLTRSGLNIYEMRAAFRVVREQPQHIPPLEAFESLTVTNPSSLGHAIHPSSGCMPQQWLKERNLLDVDGDGDDEDDHEDGDESASSDESGEESEDDGDGATLPMCPGLSPQRSNNIMYELFMNGDDVDDEQEDQDVKVEDKKGGVPGYIVQFDDEASSSEDDDAEESGSDDNDDGDGEDSESEDSVTESVEVQAAFELIGFRSPPNEVMAALEYASSGSESRLSRSGDGEESDEDEDVDFEEQLEGIDRALSNFHLDLMDPGCVPQFVKKPLMVKSMYTPPGVAK